jgi:hypothetical protein
MPGSAEEPDDLLSELRLVLFAAECPAPADPEPAMWPDPSELSISPEMAPAGFTRSADLDALFSTLCDETAHSSEPGADSTIDTMLGELLAETTHPGASSWA